MDQTIPDASIDKRKYVTYKQMLAKIDLYCFLTYAIKYLLGSLCFAGIRARTWCENDVNTTSKQHKNVFST